MTPPLAVSLDDPLALIGLIALVVVLLFVDLAFFARDREPGLREATAWSVGWLVLSLAVAIPLAVLDSGDAAVTYTTVYLIERSLSLDNLFVFLLLFAYFGVPHDYRARMLFWGIAAALVLRGLAILGGLELLERFEFLIYVLGALLLVLAMRMLRGIQKEVKPDANLFVRVTRRFYPVTPGFRGRHWFVREGDRLHATPLFLCLGAVVVADIIFAIDSIPAAFGITRDSGLIWMGNAFALLGMRALFVLVEGLIRRFRYLDESIAIVLGLVAVKLLLEDLVHVPTGASLGVVLVAFAIGIGASIVVDRRTGADG